MKKKNNILISKIIFLILFILILYILVKLLLLCVKEGFDKNSNTPNTLIDYVSGGGNAIKTKNYDINGIWALAGTSDGGYINITVNNGIITSNFNYVSGGTDTMVGKINGNKIEDFKFVDDDTAKGYSATLKLNNGKVTTIEFDYPGLTIIKYDPQDLPAPYCQFNILGTCKANPALTNIRWFQDDKYGGPKPSSKIECKKRLPYWQSYCSNTNVTMAYLSPIQSLLNKSVNIISVPYNMPLCAVDCWAGPDKCRIDMKGNTEEQKWKIIFDKNSEKYYITSVPYNVYLTAIVLSNVCDSSPNSGCSLKLTNTMDPKRSLWEIEYVGNNTFTISGGTNLNLSAVYCSGDAARRAFCGATLWGNSSERSWYIKLA